ncbi:MAG: OmpA family protein [Polyangiales bacterium]
MLRSTLRFGLPLAAALVLSGGAASAQQAGGWALDRYDAPFGGDLTLVADTPWYTGDASFLLRAALTADYAYRPLVLRGRSNDTVLIEHMVVAHAQVAVAFADRVGLSLTLPVSLLQSGNAVSGLPIPQAASGVAASDLRLAARVRLVGHADQDPFSFHFGVSGYIPGLSSRADNTSDEAFRLRVGVTAAGAAGAARWSLSAGTHLRFADLVVSAGGASPGVSVAHELFVNGALYLVGAAGRFMIGPEFSLATPFSQAFQNENVHAEVLLAARVFFTPDWSLGAAVGPGLTQGAGTPAVRALLQIGYTPPERRNTLAPPQDRDRDGVMDPDDLCPDEPRGDTPDPERLGCPVRDRDRDGVPDAADLCVDVPQGEHPDPSRRGCPLPDSDGDGVYDDTDRCVNTPAGEHPDPERPGCPDGDRDSDRVLDHDDRCPDEPQGLHPDPERPGCPAPDRDLDTIPDRTDACPDQPGAPSTDPRRNGCPGLVRIVNGRIAILRPVYFATNRDVILPRSFPVLNAVRDALAATPEVRRLSVEGHTDDVGRDEANLSLSERRAASVLRWLTQHEIDPARLESHGFGEARPIVPNTSPAARAQNRRVEFRIVE